MRTTHRKLFTNPNGNIIQVEFYIDCGGNRSAAKWRVCYEFDGQISIDRAGYPLRMLPTWVTMA